MYSSNSLVSQYNVPLRAILANFSWGRYSATSIDVPGIHYMQCSCYVMKWATEALNVNIYGGDNMAECKMSPDGLAL